MTPVLYDIGSAATPRGAWKVPGPCSVSCLPLGPGGARVLLCELPQNGGLDGLTFGLGFGEWAGTILRQEARRQARAPARPIFAFLCVRSLLPDIHFGAPYPLLRSDFASNSSR